MNSRPFRCLSCAAFALFATLSTGCSMIAMGKKSELPVGNQATAAESYTIEIRPAYGRPTLRQSELAKDVTVQEALKENGLLNKFRSMEVTILRRVPDSGHVLRLACEFQPGKREIKYEQDYALHPGDRIVISPRKSKLEKAMQSGS